jgi:hypothetical protein
MIPLIIVDIGKPRTGSITFKCMRRFQEAVVDRYNCCVSWVRSHSPKQHAKCYAQKITAPAPASGSKVYSGSDALAYCPPLLQNNRSSQFHADTMMILVSRKIKDVMEFCRHRQTV